MASELVRVGSGSEDRLDLPTIAAIGMLAYLLANVVHEALGHGGACVLFGGRALRLSSAWFDGDAAGMSAWGIRAEKAGGTLANLVAGLGLFGWLRVMKKPSPRLYYFVWLAMTVNLLEGGGYLLTSPLMGFGDWKAFLEGLDRPLIWKLGLTAIGLAISCAALLTAVRTIEPLLGRDVAERSRTARWLCWLPYAFAGALVFSIAALFNPEGKVFLVTSAAAHLGGTAWLAWLPAWVKQPRPATPDEPLPIGRSAAWIAAGGIAMMVCVFILGPSISLGGLSLAR